jgi:hypothetical protein
MKRWFTAHIISTDNITMEEFVPISNSEFIGSISMVAASLAIFAIIIHLFGK